MNKKFGEELKWNGYGINFGVNIHHLMVVLEYESMERFNISHGMEVFGVLVWQAQILMVRCIGGKKKIKKNAKKTWLI